MPKDERKDLYGLVRLELMAYMDAQKSCSKATHDIVDMICDAIDGQRCVWKADKDGIYHTSCNMAENSYSVYCSKCGKRIEVKEGENG